DESADDETVANQCARHDRLHVVSFTLVPKLRLGTPCLRSSASPCQPNREAELRRQIRAQAELGHEEDRITSPISPPRRQSVASASVHGCRATPDIHPAQPKRRRLADSRQRVAAPNCRCPSPSRSAFRSDS